MLTTRRRDESSLRGLFAIVAVSSCLSCEDLEVYAFVGHHYDEAADCIEDEGVIDVVEGRAEGTCKGVRCFEATSGDAFVSTACEAPSEEFVDHTDDGATSICAKALDAWKREATCEAEDDS